MHQKYLHDQRGVAMLLELVLVAAVLALVGLAVYQTNHRGSNSTATVQTNKAAPTSAAGLAESAANATLSESASDAALSATAETAVDEVSATDNDVTNLGGSADGSL